MFLLRYKKKGTLCALFRFKTNDVLNIYHIYYVTLKTKGENNMDESKANRYYDINNTLYHEYLKRPNQATISKLLLVNTGLLKKVEKSIKYAQYSICEAEDMQQLVTMEYINLIHQASETGEKDYPQYVYNPLMSAVQKSLSDMYGNGGVFSPYSTKKLKQRQDYDASLVKVSEFNPDIIESESSPKNDVADGVVNSLILRDFLQSLNEEEKDVFVKRYIHGLPFTKINEENPDRARYVHNRAIQNFREQELNFAF